MGVVPSRATSALYGWITELRQSVLGHLPGTHLMDIGRLLLWGIVLFSIGFDEC